MGNRVRGRCPRSVYVMLRPRIFDITKEEAIPSRAGSHKFVDLCSKSIPLLIELKWISKPGSWKRRVEEVYVDTQSYGQHPSCDNLIFVIVDSIKDVPDPRQIEAELSGVQTMTGDRSILGSLFARHKSKR